MKIGHFLEVRTGGLYLMWCESFKKMVDKFNCSNGTGKQANGN